VSEKLKVSRTGSGSIVMEENGKKGLKIFFSGFLGKIIVDNL